MNTKKYKTTKVFAHLVLATFILSVFALSSFAQDDTGFSDVSRTHRNYVAITFLNQSGVIGGYDDNTFKPENSINRAEVLKIILGGSGIDPADEFQAHFPDVTADHWFAPYVIRAKELGFVKGNDTDGTFTPSRQVNLAEFLKMLLAANEINPEAFEGKTLVNNISPDEWFATYVNYAVALGIVVKDEAGNVDAARYLTRAEVSNMMYLLSIIKQGQDTQFLLTRAESEMAQIEVYIAANQVSYAKVSSELAVDITQQAYKNMPENNVVLGAAKIARAYDYLVDSFVLGIQGNNTESAQMANNAIDKSTEAWEANNATQPIAAHIKERAREILAQVGGAEE